MDYEQKLVEWLENITNAASESVPIFVEQYCRYSIVSNLFYSVVCIIVIVLSIIFIRRLNKIWEKDPYGDEPYILTFLAILAIIFVFIFFICSIDTVFRAYFCPVMHVIKSLK